MTNKIDTKKDTSILIRLSTEEKESIRLTAAKQKQTISDYIRGKLFETKREISVDIPTNKEFTDSLKSQIQYLQDQNRYLQAQNHVLQDQNKVYQNEQLDLLQRLLLLSTQQAEKIELIEHEETKKSFWKRLLNQ